MVFQLVPTSSFFVVSMRLVTFHRFFFHLYFYCFFNAWRPNRFRVCVLHAFVHHFPLVCISHYIFFSLRFFFRLVFSLSFWWIPNTYHTLCACDCVDDDHFCRLFVCLSQLSQYLQYVGYRITCFTCTLIINHI